MGAEFFGSEVFGMPLAYVVDHLAGEMSVPINLHDVQWCVDGVLWYSDVVSCGGCWRFGGFVVLSGVLDSVV